MAKSLSTTCKGRAIVILYKPNGMKEAAWHVVGALGSANKFAEY